MTVLEARSRLVDILGPKPTDLFDRHLDDFMCCVKSWAMTDFKTSAGEVKERVENISRGIIAESIKMFLAIKYGDETGAFSLNMSGNGLAYDADMNEVVEIKEMRRLQAEIIECLVEKAMEQFSKGRALGQSILDRARKFVDDRKKGDAPRDYAQRPPLEQAEIEALRLERRLPRLSKEEGDRLSVLYQTLGKLS